MIRRQLLVDPLRKFIAGYIDDNKYGLELGPNKFHSDGDNKPRWNGQPFVIGSVEEYTLEPATTSKIGGVIIGDRISVTTEGKISADLPKWSELTETPPNVSIFSNNVKYQTESEVEQAIEDALDDYEVKNVEYDDQDHIITVTYKDDTELNITLPTLDIIDDIEYRASTKQIILIKKDGTEIPVDVSALIDIYKGSTGENIQILVKPEEGNEISAILRANSVTEAQLVEELRDKINGKINKVSSADENNLAIFTNDGQIKDSGVSIDDIKEEILDHTHDGEDSEQIEYSNLLNRPVDRIIIDDAEDEVIIDMKSKFYNVEYLISRSGEFQTGVVKVRNGSPIMEMDVFGDDLELSFSANGNNFIIDLGVGKKADVKLIVFFFS